MNYKTTVVTPWHNPIQFKLFTDAWNIGHPCPNFLPVHDAHRMGCAQTKNRGIELAIKQGADIVIILDDDCLPTEEMLVQLHANETPPLQAFIDAHVASLTTPLAIPLFAQVTQPRSRGTPYEQLSIDLAPAASMGYWEDIGDYDACCQLVHGAHMPMMFQRGGIYNQYFAMSGMNIAFWATDWPWFKFVDVPRFDDIWMGFLFQKYAYHRRKCISLNGPSVSHSRQSNVWNNLKLEAEHLEDNETFWQNVFHFCPEKGVLSREVLLTFLAEVSDSKIKPIIIDLL